MRTCGARVDLKQMPEHVAAEPGRANGHQGGWPIANGLVCSRNWSRRGDVHRSWRSGGPSEPRGACAPSGFGRPRSGFESPRSGLEPPRPTAALKLPRGVRAAPPRRQGHRKVGWHARESRQRASESGLPRCPYPDDDQFQGSFEREAGRPTSCASEGQRAPRRCCTLLRTCAFACLSTPRRVWRCLVC